jgi:hypothetical protein
VAARAQIFTAKELNLVFKVAKANGARLFKYEAPGGHKLTFDLTDIPSDSLRDEPNSWDAIND